MRDNVPSEYVEQIRFVDWCEAKGYRLTSIPNNTYTKSWMQKAKNKRMGLRPGFPDLVIIAEGRFMCVEMKRPDGGVVSKYQRQWIAALQAAGIPVAVCAGTENAIAFVQSVVGA